MSHAAPSATRAARRRRAGDSSALGYRLPALDGVRAFAVVAVFLFHSGVPWARGGFLGVDTFFVLSGYLITTLLVREADRTGRIALMAFWARRVRRLLPALLVLVLVVTIVLSLARSGPYPAYRLDAVATLGYVANWRLAFAHTDYFAQYATVSPLQHTWSLAVEEQFYLVWPLVVAAAVRWWGGTTRLLVPVLAAAAGSAALMAARFSPGHDPSRLFYGTDTRGHSLLVGIALALVLARWGDGIGSALRARRAVAPVLFAVAAVVTLAGWSHLDGRSAVVYRGGMLAMSLATAVVVACVVLVPDGVHARLLGVAPLWALGRISYGFYLWHWPVQLAMTGERTHLHGWPLIGARFAVTVAVATVSWFLVERPVLAQVTVSWQVVPRFAAATLALAAVVLLVATPSPAGTVPPAAAPAPATAAAGPQPATTPDVQPSVASSRPVQRGPGRPVLGGSVLVLGDSVASSLAAGLAAPASAAGVTVHDGGIVGCGVTTTPEYRLAGVTYGLADECAAWQTEWERSVRAAKPTVAAVLLGRHETWDARYQGRWTHIGDPAYDAYLTSQLERAVAIAGSSGAHVALLTAPYDQRPERPDGGQWPENDPHRVDLFNALVRQVAARHPGEVSVVDLGAHLSPGGRYATSIDGVVVRSDGVHFTPAGVRWMAPWLLPQLRG